MNKILFYLSIVILLFSCNKNDENTEPLDTDYRQEMRNFVIGISEYAKAIKPGFLVIPQNGIELVSNNGEADGTPNAAYLAAIDGNGQEDLFYGYDNDDEATPAEDNAYIRSFLNISKNAGNTILVTDYCSTHSKMDDSYLQNNNNSYISFAANHRELDNIPDYPATIYSENSNNISSLSQIKNFLYLINPTEFVTKTEFLNSLSSTNYDLILIDLFFNEGFALINSEVNQLKTKDNGGSRLVICYMSIGEAENYRYYWQQEWDENRPEWMKEENPDWEGNYKVWYWDENWQNIIYGNDNSYLKKILDAGFDGVYLDIIDAFEYYE